MTFGEALFGHPNASQILAILQAKETDEIPRPRFVPDWQDRKFERPMDMVEYLQRSERGWHLNIWWNHYE